MSARDAGYRLLGRRFDYLLHLRPAEWPIFAVHFLTGSALAIGLDGVLGGAGGAGLWIGLAAFVIGLNGGTLALNSAFDRDEGDIAYLRKPPAPPAGLAAFGLALMAAAVLVAWRLPRSFFWATAICFVLSLLYSVPPVRLKAVAGLDWVINMAGFGLLTPFAGWAVTGRPVEGPSAILLPSFALLFGSLYPLTQLYQLEEDTARGDRTLAVRLGVRPSLALALGMAVLAHAGFAWAGWQNGSLGLRWGYLAVSLFWWLSVLVPWHMTGERLTAAEHQRGMHRSLAAWAVTDAAVLLAFAR